MKLADKKGQVFDYDLEALAFIDMQQGDEDRLVLDKLSAHSTKEYPATAFVQVELDGNKLRPLLSVVMVQLMRFTMLS